MPRERGWERQEAETSCCSSRHHRPSLNNNSAKTENAEFKEEVSGHTLLSRAAQQGHADVVRVLLNDDRFDPTSIDTFSLTPLIWAKSNGNQSAVNMLLDGNVADEFVKSNSRLDISSRCLDFWINACDKNHGGECCADAVENRMPEKVPAWVIDVLNGCDVCRIL